MFTKLMTKLETGAKHLPGARRLRRLARREDGAVAVEFALVAAPFLALLFAIMETAMIFFAGQTLETATADTSRLIMTGQAQSKGFQMTQFKTALCSRIYAMFDCANKIQIDVRTIGTTSFASADTSKPIANGQVDSSGFDFKPGGPGCIVITKVMYEWPVFVSLLG